MKSNVFEEINQKADIMRVAEMCGFRPDRQNNIPCFIHQDHNPSLHLHPETNTWWCYVCGEGFTPIDFVMKNMGIDVLEAAKEINQRLGLGIDFKKKFNKEKEIPVKEAEYFYRRADGSITMRIDKVITKSINKKEFFPYALVDGEYKSGYKKYLSKDDCVLYNLPQIIKSDIIYFTEGEKDADTLTSLGLTGTTTPGGGRGLKSYFSKNENLFDPIKDKEIRIISDNDDTGNVYIEEILKHIKDKVKNIKVFNLCNVMPKLKKKGDISDVVMCVGKEKTLEFLTHLEKNTEIWKEKKIEEYAEPEIKLETVEDVLNVALFERLYSYELDHDKSEEYLKLKNEIIKVCKKEKITREFNSLYKQFKDREETQYISDMNTLIFDGLPVPVFNTNKYELTKSGVIYEVVPNIGKILVCYHPIVPIEKYKNLEDGMEKVKLAYYIDDEWNYIIVEKSTIASTQSIIKLSDIGIAVNSENAKHLIKYLSEIENLNRDKIKVRYTTSRLGWSGKKLVPYNENCQFDNEKEFPRIEERFGTSGTLEDWANFFRERRKYNDISRIIMAGAVASILLKRIKVSGFTIHVWGESEFGKSVSCMAGQSIFGKPTSSDTENNGIGINFNFTEAGFESRLNLYNNIPLFVNEMQLKKEAKDYDKILFMVESGQGKSRSTKYGGIGRETAWNLVAITNGEKNIVKSSSDNGAYNRCLSCELTSHSFENLPEVADFSKENYGTAIREILKHIDEYDVREIYKEKREIVKAQGDEITEKQKIIEAIIMTGDKILTDIIFKDEYYLTLDNFMWKTIKKKDTAIEERAYEVIKDWYITKKRCFVSDLVMENENKNVDVYGKEMNGRFDGHVAFLIEPLRKTLSENNFDFEQIIKAWNRKGYTKCDKGKNQKNVSINGETSKCVVLNMKLHNEIEEENEPIPVPYSIMQEQEFPF